MRNGSVPKEKGVTFMGKVTIDAIVNMHGY